MESRMTTSKHVNTMSTIFFLGGGGHTHSTVIINRGSIVYTYTCTVVGQVGAWGDFFKENNK